VWQLHDFLSAKRHDIDGKYDYRYSVLIFVFATLIREGWLHLDELKGLHTDKLTKMAVLAQMGQV
jgi:Photoprotection regulator fluorescence recovery protein